MGQGVTARRLLSALAALAILIGVGLALVSRPGPSHSHPLSALLAAKSAHAQETDPAKPEPGRPGLGRVGYLVRVTLPITDEVKGQVLRVINRLAERPVPEGQRPMFIFELWPTDKETRGAGSDSSAATALAQEITSQKLGKYETVAFIPRSIRGHAVLLALACERIVMGPDAELGEAGYDEKPDRLVLAAYDEIAGRRNTIPKAVALGMLDPRVKVYWVKSPQPMKFVLEKELGELKEKGLASEVETIKQEGELGKYSGRVLRDSYRFVSHLAENRRQLEMQLKLPAGSIEVDPTLGEKVRPVLVRLHGTTGGAAWIQRAIEDEIRDRKVNLVILEIDSAGGVLLNSLQLAHYLSDLDDTQIRTVAYVPSEAKSDAALIAFACDHTVLGRGAKLGGMGGGQMDPSERAEVMVSLKHIAQQNSRSWSLVAAMVDPSLRVKAYRHADTGVVEYFCEEELNDQPDPKLWTAGDEVTNGQPFEVKDDQAVRMGLARQVTDFAQLKKEYQIGDDLPEIAPNWAHRLIAMLADPWLAGFLVFVGFFALMVEAKSPGIGAGAFIACVCFLLFFWGQILEGNAGYLEVLMFVTGIICVALEIFILPGFGVFGIGGAVLIIVSLILASQTFVIPRNLYELQQVPVSIFTVIAAMSGILASLYIVGRYLPHTPYLSNMLLKPPAGEALETIARREKLADFEHLAGKLGVATTQLVPSGKARIGDDVFDVLSDGDLIPRGAKIVVVETLGNRVVVRQAKDE